MSAITLQLPDDLAGLLAKYEDQLPEILEQGLWTREHRTPPFDPKKYGELAEIIEFLAGLPAPEKILELEASEPLQRRSNDLLEKNRNKQLTPQEEEELNHFEFIEHLVRIAKVRAAVKLGLGSAQHG
jgi:hypothetical protein